MSNPSAYMIGIVQNDGSDLEGARTDDILIVMHNTPENLEHAKSLFTNE